MNLYSRNSTARRGHAQTQSVPSQPQGSKLPYLSQWCQHRWVMISALVPFAIHHVWLSAFPGQGFLGKAEMFLLYFISHIAIVTRETYMFRGLGEKYGYLDEEAHGRDKVRTFGLRRTLADLLKAASWRTVLLVSLSYSTGTPPAMVLSNWKWWLQLVWKIGLYGVVLDFWFYWYHRAMHEVGPLWKYHRTHHSTRHPVAFLHGHSDYAQEILDVVVIPFMTYITFQAMGLSFDFYEWWICQGYVSYMEAMAHSGLRIHAVAPSTLTWLLKALHAELAIEDHDLHHRRGWRKSFNYGKQSRLWDRAFGTCHDRIESTEANVDFHHLVKMPIT